MSRSQGYIVIILLTLLVVTVASLGLRFASNDDIRATRERTLKRWEYQIAVGWQQKHLPLEPGGVFTKWLETNEYPEYNTVLAQLGADGWELVEARLIEHSRWMGTLGYEMILKRQVVPKG